MRRHKGELLPQTMTIRVRTFYLCAKSILYAKRRRLAGAFEDHALHAGLEYSYRAHSPLLVLLRLSARTRMHMRYCRPHSSEFPAEHGSFSLRLFTPNCSVCCFCPCHVWAPEVFPMRILRCVKRCSAAFAVVPYSSGADSFLRFPAPRLRFVLFIRLH